MRGGLGGFTPHSRREFHPGDEGGFGGFPPIRGADFHAGKIAGGISRAVCLSVCPLRIELVRAGLTDRDETFGGDIWHCQERISLKPARSVEIWVVRRLKKWF